LGDCFLLVSVGTLAYQNPQRLKDMIQTMPDGKVVVSFGNGQKIVQHPPTDGEIVIGASTLNDGTWAIAMEKAIGQIYLDRQKTPRHVTPLSYVGLGGTPNTPMGFITGHKSKRVGCEDFQKGDMDAATREARLADMHAQLVEAFKRGKMIVSGTAPIGKQAIVRGLYYNHSYGVLAFDEKTDMVTFWNPFGNKFTPKGEPGLTNGYATSHGRFNVPLTEAVQWLGSFSIETDEPAD
jgi:Ni,Fe-hydrogenase III small subunit